MFRLLLAGSLFLSVTICKSGTFTSRGDGVTAPWTSASSWVFTGDADGIPDADDNVTILSSETITWNANISCNNLTVNGVLHHNTASTVRTLYIYGNYILNGSEAGSGAYSFQGSGNSISGTGSFNAYTRWTISANTTIQSNVVATKMYAVKFYGGADVTNFGNITLTSTAEYAPGSVWINGTGSTLTIRTGDIMTNGTLDVSSNVNTFSPNYTIGADIVPATFNNTCHHFVIGGNKPVRLSTNMQVNGNMTLQSGALFSTNGNDLSIRGNYQKTSSSGSFTMLAGDILTFNGSTAQTIATVGPQTLSNLVINNTGSSVSITTGNAFTITESLSLVNGTFNLSHASATMTLVSNASSTAIIGPSPNGSVTGNIRMQRFISARAAGYSTMAGCVQGQTVADWDDELLLVYGCCFPSFSPSILGYDETSADWVEVTSPTQPLTPGVGFEVYLDSDGSYTTFNATTIVNTGTPNLGTFDMSSYITANYDGWNLIGNPYHANISWDDLHATTTNISPDIMYYDETIEDYAVLTTGSGTLLAPNQGFWVESFGGASLVFTENIKTASNSSDFRSTPAQMFTIRLKSVGGTRFTSGTSFRFAADLSARNVKGNVTFKGIPNPKAPNLYSVSETGKGLKVNLLNSSLDQHIVPLHFNVGEDGLYTIGAQNIESAQLDGYTCVTLIDNKTGRNIDLAQEDYQFYAEKGENPGRFSLKMSKNNNCFNTIEVANGQVDISRLGNNTVVKLNFDTETNATITTTNLLGEQISPAQTVNASSEVLYLPLPENFTGIYLVNVFYNGRVESKKLFR